MNGGRRVGIFLVFGALILLGSCSGEWPHARVIQGNYNVSRGEYQRSIVDYLQARGETVYEPWIAYNLGNVYHFLGEADAALDQWDIAQETDVPDLQFGARFNRGVYYLEQGRYEAAVTAFRSALLVDPTSVAAKGNFEIALSRLQSASDFSGEEERLDDTGDDDDATPETTATRMLDYVRRKEEQQWRANAEAQTPLEEQDW
ncbi:MAG: tetratricopeptide repeat protein [Alkalispirochaeta sp.]